jgi:hypothetical protein
MPYWIYSNENIPSERSPDFVDMLYFTEANDLQDEDPSASTLGEDLVETSSPPPYFSNGGLSWGDSLHVFALSSPDLLRPNRELDRNNGAIRSKPLSPPRRNRCRPIVSRRYTGQPDDGLLDIITRLSSVFEDVEEYKCLLACRDESAQMLLDLFQMVRKPCLYAHQNVYSAHLQLLITPHLEPSFKRHLVVAVQRLSQNSGLYPTCFGLDDIQLVGEHPVAAGSFGDIYKGKGQHVCLKVIRIYQASRVNYLLKVIIHFPP